MALTKVKNSNLHDADLVALAGNDGSALTGISVAVSNVTGLTSTAAELNHLSGVTSAIQGQLSNKEPADTDIVKKNVANTFSANQTFTEFTETVYALTGTVIDPANGGIQSVTLSAATTFTELLDAGQTVVLMITNGLTNAITFPTITWVTSAGNVAPTLTDSSTVVMWKVGSTLYGAFTGSYV